MNNEVVVQDDSIRDLVPLDLISYDDSVRLALRERAAEGARRDQEDQQDPKDTARSVDSAVADPDTTPR
jgi:hypothetical protein